MLPPIQADDLHAALRTRRGAVVLKERAKRLFDLLRILCGKSGFLRKLAVDAAVNDIHAECHAVLGAHGVGRLACFAAFSVDALGDLHTHDLDRGNADGLLNADRPAHADGHLIALEGEDLSEAANVNPFRTGGFRIGLAVGFLALGNGFDGFIALRTGAKAVESVVAPVIGLHEDALAHILQAVAELALDADV